MTTWVSRYQIGKTNLDFTGARDSEWQWHQLDHMQVCTSLQTDNHASNPPLFFTGRMPFLPPNQQRQSTEGFPPTSQIIHIMSLDYLESLVTQLGLNVRLSGVFLCSQVNILHVALQLLVRQECVVNLTA